MNDIDRELRRLAEDRVPNSLGAIDVRVLQRVSTYRFGPSDIPNRFRVAAVAFALLMGVAGGLIPGEAADAEPSVTTISGAIELAPSTLLTGRL